MLRSFGKMIRTAWDYNRRLFGYFVLNILLTVLFSVATLYTPRFLIHEILTRGDVRAIITAALIFTVVTAVSGFLIGFMKSDYIVTLKELRASLLRGTQRKNFTRCYADLENPQKMDEIYYVQRLVNNFSTGFEGIYSRLYSMSANIVTMALYVWVLVSFSWWIGLLLIVCTIVLFFYNLRQNRRILETEKQLSAVFRKQEYVNDVTADYQYGKDIRVFHLTDWLLNRHRAQTEQIRTETYKSETRRFRMAVGDILFAFLRGGFVYVYLIYKILNGAMDIADFTLYFTAVTLFSVVLKQFFDDAAFVAVQLEPVHAYYEFMDRPDEYAEGGHDAVPHAGHYSIAFENVSFRYPGTDRFVLRNLSFIVKPGEKLAVVGINGAGKTTLVKLMTRLYTPDEGRILLNGVDIQTLDLKTYRQLFSVVFQNITIIATTLGENVALAEEYDGPRAQSALEKAGFSEKFRALETGLDTQLLKTLAADGIELSGGEKQKVAIARAIYRDRELLVLDEPTAALDAVAEHNLYAGFADIAKDKTVLFISHRLGSTKFCDHILLLSEPGVSEFGTHNELMARQGAYANLFHTQAKYYREGVDDERA